MVLNGFFNLVFGWSVSINPIFGIVFVSFVLTLISVLAYKYFTDQDMLKSLKSESKKMRDDMKNHRDNPEKVKEINKRMGEQSMKMMKQSFKPMIITFVPIILIFTWLREAYSGIGPLLFGLNWFWTYFIFTFVFSFALRKILKVH